MKTGRVSVDDFRHEALAETTSTNVECFARARAGDGGNLWVTAARQTGGRGRRGRPWVSEPGNLYASLLLIDPASMEHIGSLPLAFALAVYRAVGAVLPAGGAPLEIKWPNDILIGRKKTCGILMEAETLPDGRTALVIGIGINIAHMPDNPAYPVTRLGEHGAACGPDELFAHLFREVAHILQMWNRGQGVADVMRLWRSAACGIGEPITVNLPDRSIHGRFAGIDDKGFLLLEEDGGPVSAIAAGDVFFG
ncbi:biotin--[acetyl-CoA-carboxylase] ligase [Agrobacterium rubi]|uniref:biotin--[acetyl-CoA-carboxylase] ligase n=1 Tax=Agrobacterium rubi TaxID=28099 RepID=UPI00157232D3|nr:biotin--[acetyl-CoA-carboxylase] ligase [Agrobacterium rubi]NTF07259.1 biotin--[acetyl-CoA-carboxylase] ligase [Agrobacterium rubi]NTF19515.1 biotin--[acetyl-CoA-carboxylase] ligase [Agrobacterium rubi]NTF26478.1 biotin--[acetyl-CoA-carboxylase] ligase [Agrobacterium rubi]